MNQADQVADLNQHQQNLLQQQVQELCTRMVPQRIQMLAGYKVQQQRVSVKLDAMESPYSWGANEQQGWQDCLSACAINRYPDATCSRLKARWRQVLQLAPTQDLLFGNGSDELIQLLLLSLFTPGATLVNLVPGFVMYQHIAQAIGYTCHSVALDADFSMDFASVQKALERYQPKVLFIARPNNPTGNAFDRKTISRIIAASPGLVVIDEAYSGFCSDHCLDMLHQYPNVLIMRTMSKMGLAGLRFGLLIGHQQWIAQWDKVRLPYNINSLTQAGMLFALEHVPLIHQQTEAICRDREITYQALQKMPELEVFPTQANFITLRSRHITADALFQALLRAGILVKNLHGMHPLTKECLRISIGTPEENQQVIDQIKRAIMQA